MAKSNYNYVCNQCKESAAGYTLEYCYECEGGFCPSCLDNTAFAYFKKIKSNKRKIDDAVEYDKENTIKNINYYISSDDYEECTTLDVDCDENITLDDIVEVSYMLCNSCYDKYYSYCECCTDNKISTSRCSCYKFVCDDCKIILDYDKPICWLCVQDKSHFKDWIKSELNCISIADVIAKYHESTGSPIEIGKNKLFES